jgi:hypothetical protein
MPPISSATSRAAKAPETSLWSVMAIAPSPRSLAVSRSTSTGVAQSGEWSVCMCRSTLISRRREILRRSSGLGAGSCRRAARRK